LTNGPAYNTSNGGSIIFDGSNDYVTFGNPSNLGFEKTNPFSISIWLNHTSSVASNIISKQLNISPFTGWGMGLNATGTRLQSYIYSSNGRIVDFPSSYNDGNWYNVCTTYDGSDTIAGLKIYVNGVQASGSTILDSSPSTITSSADFQISGRGGANNIWGGRVASANIYNRTLSSTEVLQNYTALSGRFGKTSAITDYDALNFVNAALISNETQQIAINTLTTELKNAGLWSKMKAIYPFVGGTAASHKWNLKDPRDVDAAFRLSFVGGWTHSSNGALPNGTNAYANTLITPSVSLQANSKHLSYYSRTNAIKTTGYTVSIGCDNSSDGFCRFTIRDYFSANIDIAYHIFGGNASSAGGTNTDSRGFYCSSRTSTAASAMYKNGSVLGSRGTDGSATGTTSQAPVPIYIGAGRSAASNAYYDNKECSFASIGDGLTDAEASSLYTIVQKYQTLLGRQV
jgi:hypothetical protein